MNDLNWIRIEVRHPLSSGVMDLLVSENGVQAIAEFLLALKGPELRQRLSRLMELDPTLHTKSMDVQLQTLVVDAFQYLSPLPQRPILLL